MGAQASVLPELKAVYNKKGSSWFLVYKPDFGINLELKLRYNPRPLVTTR